MSSKSKSKVSRRNFFQMFVSETLSLFEDINGKPNYCLDEIHKLSDDIVKKMIPVMNLKSTYQINNNILSVKRKESF